MNIREEILQKFEEFLNNPNILEVSRQASALIRDYKSAKSDEKYLGKSLDDELTDEERAEFVERDKKDTQIDKLIQAFTEKRAEARQKLEDVYKKNFIAKKNILKDFVDLVQNEENIGAAFTKRKEIQERWAAIGAVASDKFEEIQKEYSRLNDAFSYNIDLYKAIKDHDLKRNFSLKNQVIHSLKELANEPSIKKTQEELNLLMSKWDEIGPTFQEEWDKIKDAYWSAVTELREKISNFYKDQRDKLSKNLEEKQSLIEQAKEVGTKTFSSIKEWNESSDKLKQLQEQWKKVGPVMREKNEEVWTEFRSIYDDYYAKKKLYFKELRSKSDEFVKRKKAIIAKAEELKMSDLWKETTRDIINLQKQWKEIGHAGKAEQKLWQDFRSACDHFFNNKKDFFDNRESREEENLKQKESLIEKIAGFIPGDNAKEAVEKLKEFSSQFNDIGNVPFKVKDKVYKAYKNALDKHYDKLKVDKTERENMFFKGKLDGLFSKSNAESLIKQEKDKLKRKLTSLSSEIMQYENNMGFFGNSKGAESMLGDIKKKISKAKNEMDSIKNKLKLINQSAKKQK